MLNVPKKANDALHLSMLEGCDISIKELGEVILQDSLHVLDFKQLIKKNRERHCFLFELYLVFSKEIKDSSGRVKYIYKSKLMVRIFDLFPYSMRGFSSALQFQCPSTVINGFFGCLP